MFSFLLIFLVSCAPVNNIYDENHKKKENSYQAEVIEIENKNTQTVTYNSEKLNEKKLPDYVDFKIQNKITVILSKQDNPDVVRQFINVIELAVYQKNLNYISFEIKLYNNKEELINFLNNKNLEGKVFIGPLNTDDTKILKQYCVKGAVFFSFSSNKDLADNCVYLVNFFPNNEIRAVFEHFPNNSKVALLFPENEYGFSINKNIDQIANQSNSVIVNRASYSENLKNAPEAIKELGKYELRKYELNRQKKILASMNDDESKKRLVKLEKFKTTKEFDFTHVIIADYGLRLLQVAPLLPYYDIDPNIVRFVGTGAWDDEVFYDEPSLNGSIYPGIEYEQRKQLVEDYYKLYSEQLYRTSTLPFDVVGLLDFLIKNNYQLTSFYNLLNMTKTKFSGVDGSFYFKDNIIERDLSILKIDNGRVINVSKEK